MLTYLYSLSWQAKALIVAGGLVPFIIGIPLLYKAGLSINLTLAGWGIGYIVFLLATDRPDYITLTSLNVWFLFSATIGAGFLLGGPLNALMGQSLNESPNPGLASAITSTGPALACLAIVLLASVTPKHFSGYEFTWMNFMGILCTMGGVGLIMYRPT